MICRHIEKNSRGSSVLGLDQVYQKVATSADGYGILLLLLLLLLLLFHSLADWNQAERQTNHKTDRRPDRRTEEPKQQLPAVQTAQCACVAVRPDTRHTDTNVSVSRKALALPADSGNEAIPKKTKATKRRQTRKKYQANVSFNLDFEILIACPEECT